MGAEHMILKQVEIGPMMNFVYILGCAASGQGAVIDPAWDIAAILRIAAEANLSIRQILLTHGHPDHVNGLDALLQATDAPIILHADEVKYMEKTAKDFGISTDFLHHYAKNIRPVTHGECIGLGSLSIQCLHTPGHTPGSQCFLVEGCLFSGDTLFVDACGRVDIPGGNPRQMWRSLNQTLKELPDTTILYPGHDYGGSPTAILGEQKKHNPYMNYASAEDFVRDMS